MSVPRTLAIATAFAVFLVGLSCQRSEPGAPSPAIPSPTATSTPIPVDPKAILERSGQVMQELKSFHFQLRHEHGSLQLLAGIFVEDVEGDVVSPDGISLIFSGTYGRGYAIKASVITIGDSSYMTNPLTGRWEAVPSEVSPMNFFSPAQGIASMLSRVDNIELLGEGSSGGETYRLGGTVLAEVLAPLLGETLPNTIVQVELTIDAGAMHLRDAKFTGKVTPTDTGGEVRVITISRFGEPVTIEAPPVSLRRGPRPSFRA